MTILGSPVAPSLPHASRAELTSFSSPKQLQTRRTSCPLHGVSEKASIAPHLPRLLRMYGLDEIARSIPVAAVGSAAIQTVQILYSTSRHTRISAHEKKCGAENLRPVLPQRWASLFMMRLPQVNGR